MPSDATRPIFFWAPARPFSRSIRTAFSTSPCDSSSAFLESMIPAPVASRSSLTCLAVISISPPKVIVNKVITLLISDFFFLPLCFRLCHLGLRHSFGRVLRLSFTALYRLAQLFALENCIGDDLRDEVGR